MDFISGISRPQGAKSPNKARKKTAAGSLFSGLVYKIRIGADLCSIDQEAYRSSGKESWQKKIQMRHTANRMMAVGIAAVVLWLCLPLSSLYSRYA